VSNKTQPPFREVQLVARADGKCSRRKGWWREGKDELATHSMTTEVWISTREKIPEISRTAIQEALEADITKILPLLDRKTSRKYTEPAQKRAS